MFDAAHTRASHRRPIWPTVVGVLVILGVVAVFVFRSPALEGDLRYFAGEVQIDSPPMQIHHEFRLRNTSGAVVRIEGTRATCGCTEFIPPDPEIAPGEDIFIQVSLSLDATGMKEGGVVLRLDNGQRIELSMSADGRRTYPISITPRPMRYRSRPMRPFMDIEWASSTQPPPPPAIKGTNGVSAQAGPWRLKFKGNSDKGQLALWTARLVLDAPDEPGDGVLRVQVEDLPATTVDVNWTQRVSTDSPTESTSDGSAASPSTSDASASGAAPAG